MKAKEVRVEDTWHTLGMRGTGSHDVVIDGLFVPEAGVALKRKAGEWHPLFQIIATTAFPLVYAAYLGVADRAREIALGLARKRAMTPRPGTSMSGAGGAGVARPAMRVGTFSRSWSTVHWPTLVIVRRGLSS